jgi:hypothetical protein
MANFFVLYLISFGIQKELVWNNNSFCKFVYYYKYNFLVVFLFVQIILFCQFLGDRAAK